MQQFSESQQNIIQCFNNLINEIQVDETTNTIQLHHQEVQQYLNDLIQILTQYIPQDNKQILILQHASIELVSHFIKNIGYFMKQKQSYINFILQIIPLGNLLSKYHDTIIKNQLLKLFDYVLENIYYTLKKYLPQDNNQQQFFNQIATQIVQCVDQTDEFKSIFSLEVYNILLKRTTEKQTKSFLSQFICQYYYNVIYPLSQQIINAFNQCNQKLIQIVCYALQLTINKYQLQEWSTQQMLSSIPQVTLDIFSLLQNINENAVLEQAKYYVLKVLSFFIDGVSLQMKQYIQDDQIKPFIDQWQTVQINVANSILLALQHSQNFDLYSDYESINNLFDITQKLLDQIYGKNIFVHPGAAEILLSHSQEIAQNIVQTIINAGSTRFDHFAQDDLLIIDCLRPATDLINRLGELDCTIAQNLYEAARGMLQEFLDGQCQLDRQNQNQQCQLFAGIMLIRRAIPNVDYQFKVKVAIASLQESCQLHEFVFEEAAKLIISLIYDERGYNQIAKITAIGATYQQVLQQCQNNEDCTIGIIDLLIQQYMMPDRTTFVYRMLSGILSRPIRRGDIPTQLQMQLLTQSINLLLTNYTQNQKAGMVTLIRTIIQEQQGTNQVQQTISEVITTDPHYVEIPQLISANDDQAKNYAESAISVIDMVIDQVSEINDTLLQALITLATRILSANMTISQSLFKVLNKLSLEQLEMYLNGQLLKPILDGFTSMLQQPTFTLANAIIDSITFTDKLVQCYGYKSLNIDVCSEPILNFGLTLIQQYEQYNQLTINNLQFSQYYAKLILFSGIFIVSNILSKINKLCFNDNTTIQILQIVEPSIIYLYNKDSQLFNQQLDSETKRMFLLFYSQLYLQYCKLVQICQNNNCNVQQFYQTTQNITKVNASIISFTTLWAVQDRDSQIGFKWRYQLAYSCVCAAPLLQNINDNFYQQGMFPNTFIIMFIMSQYILLQQRSISYTPPPVVSFNILNTQDNNINQIFQQIFSDMSSKAILQVISEGKQIMPFWAGVERTKYSELIRNVGNDEGYQLVKDRDEISVLRQILLCCKQLQFLSQEFQTYLYNQYQELDQKYQEMTQY